MTLDTMFKRFPPHTGGLLVPLSSPRGAAAALNAYAGCRPAALLARAAASAAVRVAGPAALPGQAETWHSPLPPDDRAVLLAALRRRVHRFDTVAVLERRQPERAGLALLLLDAGRARAFVKLRPLPAPGLAREAGALRRLARAPHPAFAAPGVLDRGTAGEWGWLATTVLPGPHHVPRAPRLHEVTATIGRALAGLPPPGGVPAHWSPMHGDLTPWNLRETRAGALLLYDWERAGWGPPGADLVLYRVAEAALHRGRRPREAGWLCARWPEAAAFWAARLRARRAADAGEERMLRAQLAILDPRGALDPCGEADAGETGVLTGTHGGGYADEDEAGAGDDPFARVLAPVPAGAA